MQKKKQSGTRRQFIKQISGTSLALGVGSFAAFANDEVIEERIIHYQKNIAANNQINIAVIGMGIMGFNNTQTALKIPGVQLVAVCDLYTGRLERAKEVYGKNLFVTNDYRKILDRKDIDAVIISTSDHFHARLTIDALQKGNNVNCEIPRVHLINKARPVFNAQKVVKKILRV